MKFAVLPGLFFILLAVTSCKESLPIPKPPLYLRTDFPEHTYQLQKDNCPYQFELSTVYSIKPVSQGAEATCHKDIELGPLNGVINFSYIKMTESLATYVNYSNDKVGEHKIKATGIVSENIIHPEKKVYGTIFKLEGDVATPFQFYLTDSVSNFVSGVVYFNSVPNYDSLRPSLNYLEKDLYHLVNTFEWAK
jgi:gliding motility-associated lipoprotein GldD